MDPLPAFEAASLAVLGWIGTCALHAVILGLLTLALTHVGPLSKPRFRDLAFKLALIGPLVTGTLSTLVPWSPWAGSLALGSETEATVAEDSRALASERLLRLLARLEQIESAHQAPALAHSEAPVPPPEPSLLTVRSFLATFFGAFALWVLYCAVRDTRGRFSLRRILRHSKPVDDPRLRAQTEQLARRGGVTRPIDLRWCTEISSPFSFGIWRTGIALPPRVGQDLSPPELKALIAHEVAHIARRDPLWIQVGHLISALLPLHPLAPLLARRLEDNAEYLCDQWSAEATGDPLNLASCLTVVASWVIEPPLRLAMGPAVAGRRSLLGQRVRRLLEYPSQPAPLPSQNTPATRQSLRVLPLLGGMLFTLGAPSMATPHLDHYFGTGHRALPQLQFEPSDLNLDHILSGSQRTTDEVRDALRRMESGLIELQVEADAIEAEASGLDLGPDFAPELQRVRAALAGLERQRLMALAMLLRLELARMQSLDTHTTSEN